MFEKIERLNEGLWVNETLWKCLLSESKKFGVCDYKDNIILPFIFDEIEMSADKKVIGKINDKLYYFVCNFEKNKKIKMTGVFYVDSKGQIVEDEEVCYVNRLNEVSQNLWIIYSAEKKKYGGINSYGNVVISFEYDILANAVTVGQYEFIFAIKDNKFGFLDKTGKVVIPLMYEHLEIFREDLASAELNGKYGFINVHNEVKIPFIYDKANWFFNGKAEVILNGKKVYIDKTGKIIAQ